jgi:hypothetical protein
VCVSSSIYLPSSHQVPLPTFTYINTKLSFHLPTNIWYFIFSSVGLVVYRVYAYSTINMGRSKKHTRLVWPEAIPATLSHTSTSLVGTWGNTNLVVLVLSKEHWRKVLYISLTSYQPKISLKPPTAPWHRPLLYWHPDRAHSRVFNILSIHTTTTKTTRKYVCCDEPFSAIE